MADFNIDLRSNVKSFQEVRQTLMRLQEQVVKQLGTMAKQDADAVAITGGTISGVTLTQIDNTFTLQDDGDITKQAQFQASGITTGTTRTYTFPDKSGTLALTDDIFWQRAGIILSPKTQGDHINTTDGTNTATMTPSSITVSGVTYLMQLQDDRILFDGADQAWYYDGAVKLKVGGIDTIQSTNALVTFPRPIIVTDTTDSTSKDTGSVILEGGMGVEKSVFVGNSLDVGSNLAGALALPARINTGSSFSNSSADALGIEKAKIYWYYDGAGNRGGIEQSGSEVNFFTNFGAAFGFWRNGVRVLDIDGNAGLTTSSLPISVTDTTDSTSTSTGSIITAGGLGIAKTISSGGGRIKNTTRVTTTYTILTTDHEVFGDTDGGVFTATLPATPVDGQTYRIHNCGSSGNNLTIGRNGNNIKGVASDITLLDGETSILTFETTEHWW